MAFQNDVVGGTTLIRNAINSPNYVPGVSGWTINRDGSAEFADVTTRGPVVVTNPSNQQVVASIGANGNIAGQIISGNDFLLNGLSLAQVIPRIGGVVGFWYSPPGTPLPNAPANNVFTNVCWVGFTCDPTRLYSVQLASIYAQNLNSNNFQDLQLRLFMNSPPGGFNGVLDQCKVSTAGGWRQNVGIQTAFWNGVGGPCTVTLQAAASDTNPWQFFNDNGLTFVVTDLGPRPPLMGGVGSPPSQAQYTVTYPSLDSETYDANSNREFNNQIMFSNNYNGFPSRTGPENGFWRFNGNQIRTDLVGASVNWARLFMYCTDSTHSGAGGTNISWLSNNSTPATAPGVGADSQSYNNVWPVPGWQYIDISAQLGNDILSGILANAVTLAPSILVGSAAFAGFGDPTGKAPYIQINYNGNAPGGGGGATGYGVGGYGVQAYGV